MYTLLVIIALYLEEWACAQECPPEYRRFSSQHTGCRPVNKLCTFLTVGVSSAERQEILNAHNSFRSKVAMGLETRGGGMPEASNMMQMEWDDELAQLAQIQAEECHSSGDCRECRMVENFPVGQTLEVKTTPYNGNNCNRTKPSWNDAVSSFYNSIDEQYNINELESYGGKKDVASRFTQLIWANTWRVGCGYTSTAGMNYEVHTYICNYGPEGNIKVWPVYKKGKPCSACPSDTSCGKKRKSPSQTFDGLCKMPPTVRYPFYPDKYAFDNLIYYCDFDHEDVNSGCENFALGEEKWTIKETLMGNIKSIRLSEREQTVLIFSKTIVPNQNFCVEIQLRQGPVEAGGKNSAFLAITISPEGDDETRFQMSYIGNDFTTYSIDLPKYKSAILSIEYAIMVGTPDGILEIRDVVVFNGDCSDRDETELGFQ